MLILPSHRLKFTIDVKYSSRYLLCMRDHNALNSKTQFKGMKLLWYAQSINIYSIYSPETDLSNRWNFRNSAPVGIIISLNGAHEILV